MRAAPTFVVMFFLFGGRDLIGRVAEEAADDLVGISRGAQPVELADVGVDLVAPVAGYVGHLLAGEVPEGRARDLLQDLPFLARFADRRDHRLGPASLDRLDRIIAVIALVGEQGLGFDDRDRHQGIDSAIVGCFPGSQDEPESASLIVAAGVDFARKAAA